MLKLKADVCITIQFKIGLERFWYWGIWQYWVVLGTE